MARLYRRGRVWYGDAFVAGRRTRKALSTDRRIAESRLADLIRHRDSRKHGHPDRDPAWQDWLRDYLAHCKTMKRRSTYNHDRRAVLALGETFPLSRLSQVVPSLLERLRDSWRASGRGIPVVNRDIRALVTMMRRAEALGMVPEQKWSVIKRFREPKGRLLYYSVQDLKNLRSVSRGLWETVALLGARAGLRRGEMRWLKWEDVDFERNRLHICPKDGWEPKDYERRWVPMVQDLRDHLESLRTKLKTEWVLDDGSGERPTEGSMTIYFKRLVRKAGLEGSLHTLRHTFASHLASAGVDLWTIAKLLGHSSSRTTEIYAHLQPETFGTAISRLPPL